MEKWSVPDWLVGVCIYSWFGMVVIWFIANCFFGLSTCNDEGYMALCCKNYAEQPMAILTFYAGWLAMRLFGDQIITLRLLMCFCLFVGAGVPCWYCYHRTRSMRWTLFTASCVVVYVLNFPFKLYGWDFGPVMYAGSLITLLVSLYDRPSTFKVIGIGVLAALTVLARMPSVIIVVPICFSVLWVATKDLSERKRRFWQCAGMGVTSFFLTFIICIAVIKGSFAAYFDIWRPENIINGHALRDIASKYYDIAKDDLDLIFSFVWVSKYAFVAIVALLFFSRRSRFIPAVIFLGYLFYRKLMLPNFMSIPRGVLDLIIILYPCIYNYKSRILCENSHVNVDYRKFWTIIIFVLALSIGSDRIILRANYYYMLPSLLVPIYPVRRGIIFWTLLFLILPNFVFSVGDRIKNIRNYRPMEEILPHHNHIYDLKNAAVKFQPLRPVIEKIKLEGIRIVSFGEERFMSSYLYESDGSYRLNIFHLDYKNELSEILDDFVTQYDCLVVRDCNGIAYTRQEIKQMMRERSFFITAKPGDYMVFERIQPKEFISVASVK